MVSEAGDVQAFLAQHPPFNHLTESQLEQAGDSIYVSFSKSGSEIRLAPDDGSAPSTGIAIVRSGSLEIREAGGALIDRLSSGDYIIPSMLYRDMEKAPRIIVLEDCLYYELENRTFQSLASSSSDIAALLRNGKTGIAHYVDADALPADRIRNTGPARLGRYVREVMSNVIVSASPATTIREAASLMKQHNISSLLIMDGEKLTGIVTDRDFRIRVLAEGVADNEAVCSVMTPDPMSIGAESELHDAQLKMMAEGVRHLPVLEGRRLAGMISQTDILRANNIDPVALNHAISRAGSVDALGGIAAQIPALIAKLVARDTRAIEIGKILTALSDGITRRLLKLAAEQYGPPPCDYAWLAFGSQARQEQALGSDQDNALMLPDDAGLGEARYFRDVAGYVNDGLDRCGMPYCPGEIMARNEKWRMTLGGWKKCFSGWIEEPSPKAVMHSSIFFDMRHIAGNPALPRALQEYVLKKASSNTIFLAMMCDNALSHSPPLGFFKTFVLETDGDHNHVLDLKKRGTIPIVDIARNYALSAGLPQTNTIDRLHAIRDAGLMSGEMSYSLIDAHEFIAGLRLKAQGKACEAGLDVGNYLDPGELSPLVRHQLKDAFSIVREAQAAMKTRFGGGVL